MMAQRFRCAPSPHWGEGRGEGFEAYRRVQNPSPRPSPYGEGDPPSLPTDHRIKHALPPALCRRPVMLYVGRNNRTSGRKACGFIAGSARLRRSRSSFSASMPVDATAQDLQQAGAHHRAVCARRNLRHPGAADRPQAAGRHRPAGRGREQDRRRRQYRRRHRGQGRQGRPHAAADRHQHAGDLAQPASPA